MNSQQTTLFSSEEIVVYGKCIHADSIITQKVDLKRIKLEMNAINERQDNMTDESQHEEHTFMPFMGNIEQGYREMWNQQSTAFLKQRKQLNKLSMSANIMKCINASQNNAINIMADKLIKCKANEETSQCHLSAFEENEKCLENALAKVKSELAEKNGEIDKLRETVRNCEHENSVTCQQLVDSTKQCGELAKIVTILIAELKCKSNELDDERTNADRLNSALEHERESHADQSKMSRKRIEDMQLQCDELTRQLDHEKLESETLACELSEMMRKADERQQQQDASCQPTREDLLKKIENLLWDNAAKDLRIKELSVNSMLSECCAAAEESTEEEAYEECEPPKCAVEAQSFCDCYARNIEKSWRQCTAESSSSSSTLLSSTIYSGNTNTADSQRRPSTSRHLEIKNYQVEVQKLLGDFHCLRQDVRKMYRHV